MKSVFLEKPAFKFISNPSLDQINNSEVRDFFEFWLAMKNNFAYPMREHFSPKDLKDHLPYITLIEHGEGRFKFTLFGTKLCESFNINPTGKYTDEYKNSEDVNERYKWLVSNKQPYYARQKNSIWLKNKYESYEIICCPIFNKHQEVNLILGRTFIKEK